MLKKIALLMMLILPMGVFAQNLKFGHINAMEIVSAMPEYTKAQSELQALNKQLGQDLQISGRIQQEIPGIHAAKRLSSCCHCRKKTKRVGRHDAETRTIPG